MEVGHGLPVRSNVLKMTATNSGKVVPASLGSASMIMAHWAHLHLVGLDNISGVDTHIFFLIYVCVYIYIDCVCVVLSETSGRCT